MRSTRSTLSEVSTPAERPTLLVLKGSRVREYLQQNQRLLAALPGQTTRTRYNKTWISGRVDLNRLEPGLPALILFSDQPYETVAPVRHARLQAYKWERDYLELDLRLEEFVAPALAGTDVRTHLDGFEPFDDGERKCFLDLAPAGWTLPRCGPGDEAAEEIAWRKTVEFLIGSPEEQEHYERAVFFRPVGLYAVSVGEPVLHELLHEHPNLLYARVSLEAGKRYVLEFSAHNPHLSEEELRYVRLAPDGRGGLSFLRNDGAFSSLVRDGWLMLKFATRGRGELVLDVSVAPGSETSSFFALRGEVAVGGAAVEPEVPGEQPGVAREAIAPGSGVPESEPVVMLEPAQLLELEGWLTERFHLARRPVERLALFREFLGKWAPGSNAVAERQAELVYVQGEWGEVLRLLQGREGLGEAARHHRFLARLEERRGQDVAGEAASLAWTAEYDEFFEHFLRLVPELPAEVRRELADRLPFAIWGDEKSCRFLRILMDLDPDADLVGIIAAALSEHAELFGLSADEVLAWLVARLRTFDRPDPDLIRALVDWIPMATRYEEAVEFLAGILLPQLYRTEGSGAVREVTEELKGQLDPPERLTLGRVVVALHLEDENPRAGPEEGVNAAVLRLTELLRETREDADAYEAEELARRLATVLAERGPAVDALVAGRAREELEAFEVFLARWEPHRAKILEDVEQKALDLAERWRGRTVHVFSGHDANLAGRFSRLSELVGLEVAVHGWQERGVLEGLQAGRDVVLILPRWAGHADTEVIEDACRRRTVECHILPQRTVNPERVVVEVWGRTA